MAGTGTEEVTRAADDLRDHWESVWRSKADDRLSWHQSDPARSLELITHAAPDRTARILDVGGGTSVLVDRLLDSGYGRLSILDISEAAVRRARERLGTRAQGVNWIVGDITRLNDVGTADVWHDRAVFHFLTESDHRRRYLELMEKTVPTGGHAIIATFGPRGPLKCSGLPVCRYDATGLEAELGRRWNLMRSDTETHVTPSGAEQEFLYVLFRRQ